MPQARPMLSPPFHISPHSGPEHMLPLSSLNKEGTLSPLSLLQRPMSHFTHVGTQICWPLPHQAHPRLHRTLGRGPLKAAGTELRAPRQLGKMGIGTCGCHLGTTCGPHAGQLGPQGCLSAAPSSPGFCLELSHPMEPGGQPSPSPLLDALPWAGPGCPPLSQAW